MTGSPLDPQNLATIRAAVDACNREVGGASRATVLRLVTVFAPLVLLVAVLASLLNANGLPEEIWTSPLHVFLYVGAVLAGIAGYFWAGAPKRLAAAGPVRLIPAMFGSIDDFRHARRVEPSSFSRFPSELTGPFSSKRFDDVVSGVYRGFPFELFEVILSGNEGVTFSGAGLAFAAEPKSQSAIDRLFARKALERVLSGIAELDSAYVFLSDNPDAARQLLTGSLAGALQWMGEMWPDGRALVALKGSDAFVLLPSARNLFELPQPPQPVSFEKDVRPMVTDVYVMLETAALMRKLT
jgi:hypothetical protein